MTLTQNVAAMVLANPPGSGRAGSCILMVRQDATGGRTLAWPGVVKWAGGLAPALTSTPNALDVYSLVTRNGGTTWLGFLGGHDFG